MKANHDKCHLLASGINCVITNVNGFEIEIVRALTFNKRVHQSFCCFLGDDLKKEFLTNSGRGNSTQGLHEHSQFWKNFTVRLVR